MANSISQVKHNRPVEDAFGGDVDYGQVVKFYDAEPIGPGRYSPPKVSGSAPYQHQLG